MEIREKFLSIRQPNFLTNNQLVHMYEVLLPFISQILEDRDAFSYDKNPHQREKIQVVIRKISEMTPDTSHPLEEILEVVKEDVVQFFNYENTRFFGYIPRSPTNVSILAESLVPIFNQFLGSASASPLATAIEALVIEWVGEILGYDHNSSGSFTMGGSQANLEAIYAGLVHILPWDVHQNGVIHTQRPVIYLTNQAHLCIPKSIRFLGLGEKSLSYIDTDDQFRMDIHHLQTRIMEDIRDPRTIPSIIVATAGTTNSGAIDDIEALSEVARKYNLWLHLDAAYGGFAILADHPVSNQLESTYLADSIAIDTHKWFYTPLEGGITLTKVGSHLKRAYHATAEYYEDADIEEEYLFRNFSEYGFALSRKWRGLMVWMNFLFYGTSGISALITRNILLADYLREKLRTHPDFQTLGHSQLGIVCFSHTKGEKMNDEIYQRLQLDASIYFVGRTRLNGTDVLRITILNEHTDIAIVDDLFSTIVVATSQVSEDNS